jgi:hypothetical protein
MTASAQADAGMKLIAAAPWLAETEVGLEALGLSQQQIDRAMSEKRRAGTLSLVDKLTAAPVPPPPADATQQAASSGVSGN